MAKAKTISARATGLHSHRWKQNPAEKAVAELWSKRMGDGEWEPTLLAYLLETHSNGVTERDYVVAATVIQWLASPVGRDFLAEITKAVDGALGKAVSK